MRTAFAGDAPLRSWLLTTDHKRIGVLYLCTLLFLLALGGAFAMVIRLEHLGPGETFVRPQTYSRLFTLHGVTMVWLFLIPSIPAAFGNYLLPLMIGAKDLAFPRLNLASYWIFVGGSGIVLASMLAGGIDTGWTFYVPYSTSSATSVPLALVGIFVVGISTIATGINFIVTVHAHRAGGLRWMRLPLFVWAIYATSVIQVLATPVLGMVLALVALDHALGFGLFDPTRGGDPLLYQHLFWFYSHPAVYIMVLPAMGVVSEVIPTFAQKNPFSYRAIVYSSIGIALVGFLTWGHHMFVAGMSRFDAGAFGLLSMLVAVFSAIKVFAWILTLRRGSISLKTPLLHVFSFLVLFYFGGTTGVAVAATSLDVHWHDTAFVVAHFHFVMVGGTIASFLAALHYWFPRMTGRLYPERSGRIAAGLVFLGFLLTFVPQFVLGNGGMPRRYATYDPSFATLQRISTVGSWVLGAGLLWIALYLGWALVRGERAGPNPWRSRSFEWRGVKGDAYDYTEAP